MRVKSFRASTPTAAFAKVKAEMGEDAVILSNVTLEEDGCKFCEVTAAVDHTPANGNGRRPANGKSKGDVQAGNAMSKDEFLSQAAGAAGWASEWSQIKGHIMALLRPQMNMEVLSPRQRLAIEYLEREGADNRVLLAVYQEMARDREISILKVLDGLAPVRPFTRRQWPQKFQVFSGPHGAGKTACLIRLALAEKKAHPKARICLVSADDGQGKGRIVLRHYAELSGLAFRELTGREDLEPLRRDAEHFDRVYIDLSGLSRDDSMAARLARLGMVEDGDTAVHLVLSPHYCPAQLEAFAKAYRCPQLSSIIWTKLDEACSFGAMINMAHLSGLPASALSYGSGLKNSIVPAKAESLWRLVFKHQLPQNGKLG